MKRLALAAVFIALLSACASVDWEQTAKESVKSACRGASNCSIPCNRNNPATFSDPQCMAGGRRSSQ